MLCPNNAPIQNRPPDRRPDRGMDRNQQHHNGYTKGDRIPAIALVLFRTLTYAPRTPISGRAISLAGARPSGEICIEVRTTNVLPVAGS